MKPLLICLVLVTLTGCVSDEVKKSTRALRKDFDVFQRGVVPNPALAPETQEQIRGLAQDITNHIKKLDEVTNE